MDCAAIWDWDGVVIDSSRQHEESRERLAAEIGKPLPADHFERGFGKKNKIIIPNILNWSHDEEEVERLGRRKEAIYRQMMIEEGMLPDLIPGVKDFLQALRQAGIPSVVGTSTERENVYAIFKLLGLSDLFVGMVASEDVEHGKPDPEVFLKGAAIAGFPPAQCVVFEDSIHGLQAGLAGGMKVVGVATTHEPDILYREGAHQVIPHFMELNPGFLNLLFEEQ